MVRKVNMDAAFMGPSGEETYNPVSRRVCNYKTREEKSTCYRDYRTRGPNAVEVMGKTEGFILSSMTLGCPPFAHAAPRARVMVTESSSIRAVLELSPGGDVTKSDCSYLSMTTSQWPPRSGDAGTRVGIARGIGTAGQAFGRASHSVQRNRGSGNRMGEDTGGPMAVF